MICLTASHLDKRHNWMPKAILKNIITFADHLLGLACLVNASMRIASAKTSTLIGAEPSVKTIAAVHRQCPLCARTDFAPDLDSSTPRDEKVGGQALDSNQGFEIVQDLYVATPPPSHKWFFATRSFKTTGLRN